MTHATSQERHLEGAKVEAARERLPKLALDRKSAPSLLLRCAFVASGFGFPFSLSLFNFRQIRADAASGSFPFLLLNSCTLHARASARKYTNRECIARGAKLEEAAERLQYSVWRNARKYKIAEKCLLSSKGQTLADGGTRGAAHTAQWKRIAAALLFAKETNEKCFFLFTRTRT